MIDKDERCQGCGAPIKSNKCEYCGRVFDANRNETYTVTMDASQFRCANIAGLRAELNRLQYQASQERQMALLVENMRKAENVAPRLVWDSRGK